MSNVTLISSVRQFFDSRHGYSSIKDGTLNRAVWLWRDLSSEHLFGSAMLPSLNSGSQLVRQALSKFSLHRPLILNPTLSIWIPTPGYSAELAVSRALTAILLMKVKILKLVRVPTIPLKAQAAEHERSDCSHDCRERRNLGSNNFWGSVTLHFSFLCLVIICCSAEVAPFSALGLVPNAETDGRIPLAVLMEQRLTEPANIETPAHSAEEGGHPSLVMKSHSGCSIHYAYDPVSFLMH
ncbi:hypothetical protein DL96DRAFT_628643 [Flagelloscypha sp. PMI_526]|nr:hypothetical protein DL96DRAFT_628643 [Flagelloscypha sp. PMI_526]